MGPEGRRTSKQLTSTLDGGLGEQSCNYYSNNEVEGLYQNLVIEQTLVAIDAIN